MYLKLLIAHVYTRAQYLKFILRDVDRKMRVDWVGLVLTIMLNPQADQKPFSRPKKKKNIYGPTQILACFKYDIKKKRKEKKRETLLATSLKKSFISFIAFSLGLKTRLLYFT